VRAVVYEAVGARPAILDVPEPSCPVGGVVVRVAATGVCRSDWHAWRGHDPVPLPHIPGHEFAGVVAEAGADVRRFAVGDRVTAPFVCGCGRCDYCAAGDAQVCPDQTQPGFTGPGSFAELVVVEAADTNLVSLPTDVDFVSGAALGCRFATAFRAVVKHGRVREGDWVAVFGCGGVGLSAVMIAVALGARVVAVDVSAAALNRAAELGATVTLRTEGAGDAEEAAAQVRDASRGGVHVSLEALGSPATAIASIRSLRRRGRHIQVGLLLGAAAAPPLPMDLVIGRELEIYGSHGLAARDYPPMLAMVASGALQPGRLVGRVIGLDEAPAALMAMDQPSGTPGLTVIDLSR
jgi:D-arabinose 1-dehydrogenase-like Zn-dependent alcohol dehydrogenase